MGLARAVGHLAAGALVANPTLMYLGRTRSTFEGTMLAAVLPSAAVLLLAATTLTASTERAKRPDAIVVGLLLALWGTGLAMEMLRGGEDAIRSIYLVIPSIAGPALLAVVMGPVGAVAAVSRWILVVAVVLCFCSLMVPEFLFVPSRETYTPLRSGWFANPNMYGAMAMHGLGAYLLLKRLRRANAPGVMASARDVVIVCIFVASIVLSASRGSMAGAAAMVVIASLIPSTGASGRLVYGLRVVGTSVVGLVLIVVFSDALIGIDAKEMLISVMAKQEAMDLSSGRLFLWSELLSRWWRQAPFTGFGTGSATDLALLLGYSSAHNGYVRVAVEYGLLGIGLTVGLLTRVGYVALLSARQTRSVAIAVIAGLLVHSLFEDHIFSLGLTIASVIFSQLAMVRPPVEDASVGDAD